MAGWKPAKSTASNKEPAPEGRRAAVLEAYLKWLEGRPLAARGREAYAHQVRRYLAWLEGRAGEARLLGVGKAVLDRHILDLPEIRLRVADSDGA